ncbi:thiamine biosynthesis protein ThiF [Pleurocapsa sp. CCALA 161]|uniref:ThiF family adenylyltransferase n=1 Tax=Pleurocapsa sp. CCALA 161 TaxID=2107688 RepID=UPI000D081EAE|nr:ThiF family adenylyltransferase [Pleurocapsa sp. CCALA 161]PSB07123.1 thiamine biosynthesis protein ThiF [Pleurocapsa sp. CCALA 161]
MFSLSSPLQLNFSDLSILNAKPIYFGFPHVQIYVVGCGGTGSFLIPHLCRIANFLNETGRQIDLTLIDFDRIEEKNLYRQNFCQAELGYNKAQALAMRYKTMFPKLTIAARSDSIDAIEFTTYKPSLIVGCVDNARARASIEELMIQHASMFAHGVTKKPCWWLDCGNSYTHGQVAIGNWDSVELDDYVLEPATCIRLPLPTIQYPELLLQQVDEDEDISCAEQALLNGQSLNINSQMAIVAGEMIHQLLNSQLKRMQVEVDIFRGSVSSTWISQENIDRLVERAKAVVYQ